MRGHRDDVALVFEPFKVALPFFALENLKVKQPVLILKSSNTAALSVISASGAKSLLLLFYDVLWAAPVHNTARWHLHGDRFKHCR